MKEFYTNVNEDVLKTGLRARAKNSRNHFGLVEALNVRCGEFGLENHTPIESLFITTLYNTYGMGGSFPFPQIFLGLKKAFVLDQSAIYELDLDSIVKDTTFTLTEITTYDASSTDVITKPLGGDVWSFIDFGDVYLFVNGTSSILAPARWFDNGVLVNTSRVFVENSVSIQAGCKHMGRSVLGGFNSSNFWNSEWRQFWLNWTTKNSPDLLFDPTEGLGTNFIMWSMSGGGDVFKLFFNSLAIQGVYKGNTTYSDDNPAMFDMLRRGDAGFMPMSWKGTVQEIKPIGQKSLLVYGDTGISLLNWYNEFLTYGEVVISHIGVANKGAVGGDTEQQLFVDGAGVAWLVVEGKLPKRLGYEEWLNPLISDGIYVSYDPDLKDFYISSKTKTYLLTKSGMSEVKEHVTSIIYYDRSIRIGV